VAGTCGQGEGLSDSINAGNFLTFTLAFALQLRKKARKNLSQGKKNLSQVKKNLSKSTP